MHDVVDATFERPVVTAASAVGIRALQAIQQRRNAEQDGRRVWFCGAYSLYAIPLLENGIRSALHVVRAMGGGAHIPKDFEGYESIDQNLLRCGSGADSSGACSSGGGGAAPSVVSGKARAKRRRRTALSVAAALVLPLCVCLGVRMARR